MWEKRTNNRAGLQESKLEGNNQEWAGADKVSVSMSRVFRFLFLYATFPFFQYRKCPLDLLIKEVISN